jgi:oligoendopeptidase F
MAAAVNEMLPSWNLSDLYRSAQDPQLARDLDEAQKAAEGFAARYEGKLAGLLSEGPSALEAAISEYERISEILGRAGSFAMLLFAADMSDAAVGKFRTDIFDRINAITRPLIFFELELNTLADAPLQAVLSDPALARYASWVQRGRRFKLHQLSDELERFIHDLSVTGTGAWIRLFAARACPWRARCIK